MSAGAGREPGAGPGADYGRERAGRRATGDQSRDGRAADAALELKAALPYASRGGFKLAHALAAFGLAPRVAGQVALDAGASTGGFTDVLLQAGAARVYAVDVGSGQIAWKLRTDPRVVVMENTNIRFLEALPEHRACRPPTCRLSR